MVVRANLARQLGLKDPQITWYVARDNVAEIINTLAIFGGSLGKVALDVMMMSSNELGEVSEPFVPHRGASSTKPQKRNPISSEVVLAASKLLRANAGLAMDAMVSNFERASGPWHLEWVCVPESFIYCSGALHQAIFALGDVVVNVDGNGNQPGFDKGHHRRGSGDDGACALHRQEAGTRSHLSSLLNLDRHFQPFVRRPTGRQ